MTEYVVKAVSPYGEVSNEVVDTGKLVGFTAINNTGCAILLRENGTLFIKELRFLQERSKHEQSERMAGHTSGSDTNNIRGDGQSSPGPAQEEGGVRGAEGEVSGSVQDITGSRAKNTRRTKT